MKKFSFRLEKLLKLKERVENLKLHAHEAARMRVEEQDRHLQSIESERAQNTERERSFLSGSLNVTQLRAYSRYFHHLHNENKAGVEIRCALEKERVSKQGELVEAARERKGLEEFEEKLRVRHEKAAEKAERSELDEIAAQRFIFDRRENNRR